MPEHGAAPPVAGHEIARWQVLQADVAAKPDMPAASGTDRSEHLAIRQVQAHDDDGSVWRLPASR